MREGQAPSLKLPPMGKEGRFPPPLPQTPITSPWPLAAPRHRAEMTAGKERNGVSAPGRIRTCDRWRPREASNGPVPLRGRVSLSLTCRFYTRPSIVKDIAVPPIFTPFGRENRLPRSPAPLVAARSLTNSGLQCGLLSSETKEKLHDTDYRKR